eukprot:scaffold2275_cov245-Pinguiococcus_pyrenoidosus.AAC.4
MVISGIPGSVLAGYLIDYTGKHMMVVRVYFALGAATALAFSIAVRRASFEWSFALGVLAGAFQTGIMSAGLELAAEVAYPVPEALGTAIINIASQLVPIPTIFLVQRCFLDGQPDLSGAWAGNLTLTSLMFAGLALVMVARGRSKRLESEGT